MLTHTTIHTTVRNKTSATRDAGI